MTKQQSILGFFPEELTGLVKERHFPAYRAKQILDWIYKKNIFYLLEMPNLPQDFCKALAGFLKVLSLACVKKHVSAQDKTIKYIFKTEDGNFLESVFIPQKGRFTVCLSSQAGCSFNCVFCASGSRGYKRNLTVAEIVNQLLWIKKEHSNNKITNIVFMGMGEPLANYESVLKAIKIFNHPDTLCFGARRITISTCGLAPEISRLIKENLQVELSISLHAANDKLRDKLMPVNKIYPLRDLIAAAREYTKVTHRVVTFEYVLISGINDREQDAQELIRLLRTLKCKINLIPFNETENMQFRRVSPAQLNVFKDTLMKNGLKCTLRRSRGEDILAACGQLRLQLESTKR
ncbi:MAG: 23S rRNA (adenine(2503)-C(2))-methyltransferase RlmN [Candidatus Omnitrophica bacterium]|nr:23S rRNA (adenine(2503)-C(2))-methyltransferase RlmN [Candidatus Omnitrophota bacterium]